MEDFLVDGWAAWDAYCGTWDDWAADGEVDAEAGTPEWGLAEA